MIFYSSFEPIYLLLPLIGFLIGMFGAMVGGGGGFIFIPTLTLLIGVPPHVAVPTSLAATLPICFVGSLGHYQKGNVDTRTAALFIISGIVGAFTGAGITGLLSEKQLKVSFGIYTLFIALNIVYSTWKKSADERNAKQRSRSKLNRIGKGSFYGYFAGLIAGTFGTNGTAPVLAGLLALRLPLKLVVGTSMLVVLVNTLFAVGAHFIVGKFDISVVGLLTSGSVIGALLGTRLVSKAKVDKKENRIRYIYAMVMVTIGLLMMLK